MPFAIENVRVTDLTWLLAGAGGPRMLASLGAEDIRVEWKDRLDVLRQGNPTIPIGKERERVFSGETVMPESESVNQGGHFAGINAGKRPGVAPARSARQPCVPHEPDPGGV